jgi:hypothetical protein
MTAGPILLGSAAEEPRQRLGYEPGVVRLRSRGVLASYGETTP